MDKLHKERLQRFLIVSISILAILFSSVFVSLYAYPFIIALLISMLLNPIVSIMEQKWKIHRGAATIIVIFGFFAANVMFAYILLKRFIHELTLLAKHLPAYLKNIYDLLYDLETRYAPALKQWFNRFGQWEAEGELSEMAVQKLREYLTMFVEKSVVFMSQSISSFTYTMIVLCFIMLAAYFMTKDFPNMKSLFARFIPERVKLFFARVLKHFKQSFVAVIKAQLSIAFLTAILSFIGLRFFKVEHSLVISAALFFVDLIPYVGIGIVFLPWLLYSFFQKQYVFTVELSLLYGMLVIIRQIIEPRLLAKNLGIHPLATIIILFLSIEFFGAFGVFLTPLILIVISSLYHAKVIQLISRYIKDGVI